MGFPFSLFFLFVNVMIIGSICLSCLPIESKVVLEGKYRVLQISLACAPAFFYCLAESTSRLLLFSISGSAQLSFLFLCTAVLSGLDSLAFLNLILEILFQHRLSSCLLTSIPFFNEIQSMSIILFRFFEGK